jgi:ABC-type enterobactin transport system permease subunit
MSNETSHPRIVILGAGVGGTIAAFEKYFMHKIRKGESEPFYSMRAWR